MPRIGQLNTRLKIQSQAVSTTGSDFNEPTPTWTTDATVWAARDPGTGREFLRADQPRSEIRTVWTVYHRSGVTTAHRLVEADSTATVWDIAGPPIDPDGRRHWLRIDAVRRP